MAKEGVMRDLRRRAMKLSNWHEEDAKDLLAKSLARVLDESDQPFRAGTHTFAAHMFVVMRQTQYRLWRRTEKEAEVLESGQAEGTAGDERPRDDDQLERMRSLAVLRMLGPRVLAELGSDRLARQVYETTMKEDLDPAEARTRFNCTTEEPREKSLRGVGSERGTSNERRP
jgi:hypothetical protein